MNHCASTSPVFSDASNIGLHERKQIFLNLLSELSSYSTFQNMPDNFSIEESINRLSLTLREKPGKEFPEHLELTKRRFFEDTEALRALASFLYRHDRFEDAIAGANHGLSVAPLHPVLHFHAARAYSITGNTVMSLVHDAIAAALLPDDPYIQFHFACAQLCLGEFEQGWKRYAWFYAIPEFRNRVRCC
ncbi:MAG: hypothetical protein LBV73_01775 [Paraburkholderia sp.]|jgi:hypothetical protein|nr:hypothetical protein [Paraburkholderia sp.]